MVWRTGCWRDPLPFVANTAVTLVSNLAVLFHALAEEVWSVAKNLDHRHHRRGAEPQKTADERSLEEQQREEVCA